MNKKALSVIFKPFYCPIPEDQKTINEYLNIKKNFKNNFFLLSVKNNLKIQNLISFFVLYKVLSFVLKEKEITAIFFFGIFFFYICVFAFLFSLFQLIELSKKMSKSKIFYEESSWFNIEYWEKFFFLIKNDRLILNQKIRPILKKKFRLIISIVSSSFFLLILTNSIK